MAAERLAGVDDEHIRQVVPSLRNAVERGSIPSKWANLASYLSPPSPPPKPTHTSTSTNRVHLENERQEALEYAMFMQETVLSAQDFYDKLSSESLPSGFLLLKTPKGALVKIIHSAMKGLDITPCLEGEEDLSFRIFCNNIELKKILV
nr:uncharacterized protein LOC121129869 [Lepeophtheirus salmonis]